MVHVDMRDVKKLLDTIQVCEEAVLRLKHNPPLHYNAQEVDEWATEFSRVGARCLSDYYRLTAPLFQEG